MNIDPKILVDVFNVYWRMGMTVPSFNKPSSSALQNFWNPISSAGHIFTFFFFVVVLISIPSWTSSSYSIWLSFTLLPTFSSRFSPSLLSTCSFSTVSKSSLSTVLSMAADICFWICADPSASRLLTSCLPSKYIYVDPPTFWRMSDILALVRPMVSLGDLLIPHFLSVRPCVWRENLFLLQLFPSVYLPWRFRWLSELQVFWGCRVSPRRGSAPEN